MSTPFDIDSVEMLHKLGVKGFKVASCDLNNFLLLEKFQKQNYLYFYQLELQILMK